MYVEGLIAPGAVNTMPLQTLLAFADHGDATRRPPTDLGETERVLAEAEQAGVDLRAVTAELEREGVEAFRDSYDQLRERIASKLAELAIVRQQGRVGADPGRTDNGTKEGAMRDSSPARLYALIFGVVLVGAGILGFFYEAEFTSDKSVRDAVLGILDVNGWHNVVHLATGLLGLAAYGAGAAASRTYALGFGVVYVAVAAWGFAIGSGDSILSIIPVNTEDNVLHLLIGLAGLAAYAASSAPSEVGRARTT